MSLTLSVAAKAVRKALKAADGLAMILNQAVRRFLEELAGSDSAERDVAKLRELSARAGGHSRGWRFNRDEVHERP